MTRQPTQRRAKLEASAGFTLIELAIGIFILALLLGSLLMPLQTQVESRKIEETRRILEHAREALLGYASAHGYFPCPATAASNGFEPADANHDTGACPSGYFGFLPAAHLGLTPVDAQGYGVDAWGTSANRVRYAIAPYSVGGVANAFTRSGGMAAATIPSVGAEADLFYVCGSGSGVTASNCGTAGTLTTRAVFVVWSLGANAATGGTSTHEAQNVNGTRVFVSRPRSDVAGAQFDDILVWTSPAVVVSRLVAAAQLP